MKTFNMLDKYFQKCLGLACVLLFAVMISTVFAQVVMRYVFNSPLAWSEELARFSMIWLAMLASALCARFGQHIALADFIPLPARVKLIVNVLAIIVIACVLALLTYHSWDLTNRASRQTTSGLGISMSYAYAALPVGSLLMIIGLILGWIRTALQFRETAKNTVNAAP